MTPVVEWNDDFSIKSLALKQTCHIRGKNKLRCQKIDVGLVHGDNFEVHVIEGVILSDKEEMN